MTAVQRRTLLRALLSLVLQVVQGVVGLQANQRIGAVRPLYMVGETRQGYFDPRDFGAVGDGASHTAQATIKISTLVDLAAFTVNGARPYSFAAHYPFGVLFNLNPERTAATGSTSIDFKTTGMVAVQIPTTRAIERGARTMEVGDLWVTADQTAVAAGTPVVCNGGRGARNEVARKPNGHPGQYEMDLANPVTEPIPLGTLCTFFVRAAANTYSLPLVHQAGVNRGDFVTGPGIQKGTQVDWVNHAKMEIVLSLPTMAETSPGEVLTFTPSWLARVSVGMEVSGPPRSVPYGATVASVDVRAGKVGLSTPLAGPVFADTAMIDVPESAQTSATPITFYRRYSDREAAALQMDRLGIQAAIFAANAIGGAAVNLPAGGPWQIDGPIVMPIFKPTGIDQATVAFGGIAYAENGSVLLATNDFGPGTALITCGDPTAKSSNLRGIYAEPNGYLCTGSLHDLRIRPRDSSISVVGLRPKWNGTPVAMDGVKEGPRLKWERVSISGFDSGALAAFDHTRLNDSRLIENFIGLRLDDEQHDLHGDEVFDRLYSTNNTWAAVSVSPRAYLNGEIRKPYFSNTPYGIFCEPGPRAKQCIQGTTILDGNDENIGCGTIKDGGIRDGFTAAGGTRAVEHLVEINNFELGKAGFGKDNVPTPAGGCTWAAYFDVGYVMDWKIESVWTNDFAPVNDAAAYILRARRIGGGNPMGDGGFLVSGGGVWNVIQNANSFRQNIVSGPMGPAGEFWSSGSWEYVTLEGATFRARPMPFIDEGASALPLGTLLEYKSQAVSGMLATQLATAAGPIAGVSCQEIPSNPSILQIAPVVCFGGSRVPLRTSSLAKAGEVFAPSRASHGRAELVPYNGSAAALSDMPGASATLTYAKPLWAGQN